MNTISSVERADHSGAVEANHRLAMPMLQITKRDGMKEHITADE